MKAKSTLLPCLLVSLRETNGIEIKMVKILHSLAVKGLFSTTMALVTNKKNWQYYYNK